MHAKFDENIFLAYGLENICTNFGVHNSPLFYFWAEITQAKRHNYPLASRKFRMGTEQLFISLSLSLSILYADAVSDLTL